MYFSSAHSRLPEQDLYRLLLSAEEGASCVLLSQCSDSEPVWGRSWGGGV